MEKKKRKSVSHKLATRNDGTELEYSTLEIMRLFPGATVEHQKKLAGKKVDNYCVLSSGFMPPFRIAIECKDWDRPLTRQQTTLIVAEYIPLLDQHLIEQFLLVTRNSIVPDAKSLFDGRRLHHLTYTDLADKVLDPTPLVDNMVRQYSAGGLDKYYIPQAGYAPDLTLASTKFDLVYNEFIDFALAISASDLMTAKQSWKTYGGKRLRETISNYDQDLFEAILYERETRSQRPLEQFVKEWVENDGFGSGLALLGSYGTGKSSFAKRIAYLFATHYREHKTGRIPFLIELKEFGSHQDIRGLITHELVNRHRVPNGSFELFQSLNAAGRFLLILDGFDEMKQGMTIDSLIYNFYQIASLYVGRSKILLCGRPTIFESQEEQTRVFKGDLQLGATNTAKYIQVEIAAFSIDEVTEFLIKYTNVHNKQYSSEIKGFVKELKYEASRNDELASLVSRPVHLPMLAAVIPRLHLSPKYIRRSSLYKEFIDAIIEREMLKRKSEFQALYSIQARRKFATELAVEMYRRGEFRSIRATEIPDSLLADFIRPGYPKDAVRRDLVAACFLERKPPDILFFPHKSYLEYLVAEYVVEMMRNEAPHTDSLDLNISTEILSFVSEIADDDTWARLLTHSSSNTKLLRLWLQNLTRTSLNIAEAIENVWVLEFETFPLRLREEIIEYYERQKGVLSDNALILLYRCLNATSEVIAVHAYRALKNHGKEPSIEQFRFIVGTRELVRWNRIGYIVFEKSDELWLKYKILEELAMLLSYLVRYMPGKFIQLTGF